MSVSTRTAILFAAASLLCAPLLFANNPSGRTQVRMTYDQSSQHLVLFGGLTAFDSGTKQAYDLGDTWEWADGKWNQMHPAVTPPPRSIHVMVYDPVRSRTVMFGGKTGSILPKYLNDTWAYASGVWTELKPATQPPVRAFAGAGYDSDRDRIVMYGGSITSLDATQATVTTNLYDTWEFDGTDWKQVGPTSGPQYVKPILEYDKARHQMLMMIEETTTLTPHMYRYEPDSGVWTEITGVTLPTCVNDAQMRYRDSTQTVILTGGVCSSSSSGTFEWDGAKWTTLTPTLNAPFAAGAASAYDISRDQIVTFGGTLSSGEIFPVNYAFKDNTWTQLNDLTTPGPRSLHVFETDPTNKVVWMFGGIDENSTLADFWQYVNGGWLRTPYDTSSSSAPVSCLTPVSAFDTDRQKLVVVCADSTVYEWDGTAWKQFTNLKPAPPARRFSNMVYDRNIKKSVLFGGYDDTNYLNQTWTWNGTAWAQVKNKPPTLRSHMAMWFDPTLNKTVVYGGIGRKTADGVIVRFSDMWSFDGTGWTDMKIVNTPGPRYGAQVVVDPRNNHVYLFGGISIRTDGTVQNQVYKDDTWEWDGAAWTEITTANSPDARENGAFEYDPGRDELVLFGGYAGHYLSDVWVFDGQNWTVRPQAPPQRRRAGR